MISSSLCKFILWGEIFLEYYKIQNSAIESHVLFTKFDAYKYFINIINININILIRNRIIR